MKKQPSLFALFIAYNAAGTLKDFYANFPKHLFDEIILVDDASVDNTFELAQSLGIKSYRNKTNKGYGGNMKRALSIGLLQGGDVFVDIHPDGEYLPSSIPAALSCVKSGAQFVLGNRFGSILGPLKSGMLFWKILPIWFLNFVARTVLGVDIKDMHQGFRVYTREMLEKINFENNSDDYLFSFELIAQAAIKKIPIAQVLVETHYRGSKRGASLKKSILYTLGTFKTLLVFLCAKWGVPSQLFEAPQTSIEVRAKNLAAL